MNYDPDDGSGIRRLTDTQRLELMRAMETEDCDDAELSTFAVPPVVAEVLPPPPAAEASRGLALMVQSLYGRTQFEADEVDGEVAFV